MNEQARIPRGIRLNNPTNIRLSSAPWQGQSDEQDDPDFMTFTQPWFGIRAAAIILGNYQKHDGCTCIEQFINRWAPPEENNSDSYIKHVVSLTGIDRYQPCDTTSYNDCRKLVLAIIQHENGQMPYDNATVDKGLSMAGLDQA